jgi:hypothetical protein
MELIESTTSILSEKNLVKTHYYRWQMLLINGKLENAVNLLTYSAQK